MNRPLTRTMTAELRCIAKYGTVRELDDYSDGPLACYAQEKVIEALLRRNLIRGEGRGYAPTEAGLAALSAQDTRTRSVSN